MANIRREGQTCLSIGGDHSIAIGTIHGNAQVRMAKLPIFKCTWKLEKKETTQKSRKIGLEQQAIL